MANTSTDLNGPSFGPQWDWFLCRKVLNTALETTIDVLHPDKHPMIGRAKDMAAGATLSASIVSIIIGIYIFAPHVMSILQN